MFNILIGGKCLEKSRHGDHKEGEEASRQNKCQGKLRACHEETTPALTEHWCPVSSSVRPQRSRSPSCDRAWFRFDPRSQHAGWAHHGAGLGSRVCWEAAGEAPTAAGPVQHAPGRHHGKQFGVFWSFICFVQGAGEKKALFDPIKSRIFHAARGLMGVVCPT